MFRFQAVVLTWADNRGDENCETVLLYPLSYSPEDASSAEMELVGLEPTTCSSDSIRHRFVTL